MYKEKMRDCHTLEETKETRQPHTMWDLDKILKQERDSKCL